MTKYLILFAALALGAPSWLLAKYQMTQASAEFCVGLRFVLAFVVLEIFRKVTGKTQRKLTPFEWGLIFLQGLFLHSINLWLCYYSSFYMVSGLIAVTVSTMIIPNMIFGQIFLKVPIRLQTLTGAFIGILGVCILFGQELLSASGDRLVLLGFVLAFVSTFFSVIGTQISGIVLKRGISVSFCTSRALLIGGLISIIAATLKDGMPTIPIAPEFWFSIVYLAVASSSVAYALYNYMIKHYGPGVASYLWIAMPAVCMTLSAVYEDYLWTPASTIGILAITLGGFFTGSENPISDSLRRLMRRMFPLKV